MTISTTNSINRSIADGVETTFYFTFHLLQDEDLDVYGGNDLISPSSYVVNIDPDNVGGNVVFTTPPAENVVVTMQRNMTLDQQTSYPVAGPFQPKTHEAALDKLTMLVQQVKSITDDAIVAANWKGTWVTATDYSAMNVVKDPTSGNFYVCAIDHTSAASFATDLASGKWLITIDVVAITASADAAVQAAIALIDLPDPSTGQPGDSIVVNGTSTGWEFGIGGGLTWSVQTASLTSATGNGYLMNTSAAAKTVTLHATPVVGDTVAVGDYSGTFSTYGCIVARNGALIQGVAADLVLNITNQRVTFVYSGATVGWVIVESSPSLTQLTVPNLPMYGNVKGFDITKTADNTLTVTKGWAIDSTGLIPLALTADTAVTIPTVANTIYHLAVVRLLNQTITVLPYLSEEAMASDVGVTIDAFRWIGFWLTDGSGNCVVATITSGRIFFNDSPLVATHTTGDVTYNFATLFPIYTRISLTFVNVKGTYSSSDYTNTLVYRTSTSTVRPIAVLGYFAGTSHSFVTNLSTVYLSGENETVLSIEGFELRR